MNDRSEIAASRRWVVKVGSALLTNDGQRLAVDAMAGWGEQIAGLRKPVPDELVEVAPGSIRVRKRTLPSNQRSNKRKSTRE